MAARTIRELLVSLGVKAETKPLARFNKGMKRVKSGMGAMVRVAGVATLAIAAVTGSMVRATLQTARYGDESAKAAKRVGVTAQEMQELTFAAEQSGAAQTDVESGLRRLGANAVDAANGIGEAKAAFDALGITAREDLLGGQLPLLEQVSDAMKGLTTDQERLAVAQDIFGRGGARILPLLNEGADGIRKLREQARLYGRVMSDEATANSERFIDAMNEAKSVLAGLRNTIGIALMPTLIDLTERFRDFFLEKRGGIQTRLTQAVTAVGEGLTKMGDILEAVDRLVVSKVGGWENVFKAFGTVVVGGLGIKALIGFSTALAGVVTIASAAVTALGALGTVLGVGVGTAAAIVAVALGQVTLTVAAVAAGVGASLLIWEDLITFLTGGKSVLGAVIDLFIEQEKVQGALAEVWASSVRLVQAFGSALAQLARIVADALAPAFKILGDALRPVFDMIKGFATTVLADLVLDLRDVATLLDTISAGLESFSMGGDLSFAGAGQAAGQLFNPFGESERRQQVVNQRTVSVGGTSVVINGSGLGEAEMTEVARAVVTAANRQAMAALAGGER